jgi:DnaJ like chaperone protein
MRWTGKILGGVIGALALGPIGAAVGALLGHQFDEKAADPVPGGNPDAASVQTGDLFFRVTFEVMGHLAKADGRVSEDEIRAARNVMTELRLNDAQVRAAIAHFSRGKAPDFDLDTAVGALRQAYAGRPDLLGVFVEIQMRAQLAGTNLAGPARFLLQRIGARVGFSAGALARMEAILRIRAHSQRNSQAGSATRLELAEAFEVLELAPNATDDEIVKAYRRQLSRHHPDKLKANGLPDSMIEHAKQRTQQIIEAWDLLREQRGIR